MGIEKGGYGCGGDEENAPADQQGAPPPIDDCTSDDGSRQRQRPKGALHRDRRARQSARLHPVAHAKTVGQDGERRGVGEQQEQRIQRGVARLEEECFGRAQDKHGRQSCPASPEAIRGEAGQDHDAQRKQRAQRNDRPRAYPAHRGGERPEPERKMIVEVLGYRR